MPIPDLNTLLSLEWEELGAHVLLAIKAILKDGRTGGMVHLSNDLSHVGHLVLGLAPNQASPADQDGERDRAVTEAWIWLETQGLLVPASGMNGQSGFRVLGRRAERFTAVDQFVSFVVARRLDPAMLNERIRGEVWAAFIRGHFSVAALVAMRAVEIAVREEAGYGNERYGRVMIAAAFNPENGPLTDQSAERAEREARRDLFSGAIGLFKNPLSHRDVDIDDPAEAVEVVLFANHLLRIVERQSRAMTREATPQGRTR